MAKGKVGALDATLQYLKNKLPQTGFFSTLDELIANAPFEKAPLDQWKSYLQPGRVFEREGVRFPLKKEEIDYSGLHNPPITEETDLMEGPVDKERLRRWIQLQRPDFRLRVGLESPKVDVRFERPPEDAGQVIPPRRAIDRFPEEQEISRQASRDFNAAPEDASGHVQWDQTRSRQPPSLDVARYPEYSHDHKKGTYEESATRSTDFGPEPIGSHFGQDVISHSRTTLQPTTDQKLMRLIEEIQSDRHQRAAEKIYPDKRDSKRAQTYRDMLETGRIPEEGRAATPNELEDASLVLAEIEGSMKRRGYKGTAEEVEQLNLPKKIADANAKFRELHDQFQELDPDLRGQRFRKFNRAVDQAREEKQSLESRLEALRQMVHDAPFKDPADYATLELKNQMLNAAKQGQDYLGLVKGEDVSNRFGHTDDQRTGNAYAYDKIYKGALEKLARQYGIGTDEVALSVKDQTDTRPNSMIMHDWEDIPRMFESHIFGGLDALSPGEWPGLFDQGPRAVLNDMVETFHNHYAGEIPSDLADKIKDTHDQITDLRNETAKFSKAYEDLHRGNSSMADLDELKSNWTEDMSGSFHDLEARLSNFYDQYEDIQDEHSHESIKSFPAMKLTPEIREKIKRIGVPIWSLGATGVGLSMLDKDGDDPGFAEGGFLSDKLEALKRQFQEGQKGRDYLRSGVLSQLEGLNDKGEAGFESPLGWKTEKGELTPYLKWRPGMVDELMALPTLGSYLGIEPPAWANEAQDRTDRLHKLVRQQMELGDPDNFGDSAMESLGMMLSQIPVPVRGEKVMGSMAKEAGELGSKVAGSPLEFLLPTVNPREPGNYLFGSLAGGVLGQLGANGLPPQIEPIKKAEGGEVSIKPLQDMLDRLRERFSELTGGDINAFEE